MPLGEIAGEAIGALFRFLGYVLIEGILDFAVRGLGYAICRLFYRSVNPDGALVLFVGIVAWIAILFVGVEIVSSLQEWVAVDSCLDGGGKFDYESGSCIRGG